MILDVRPEPDDLRATFVRHIDFPAVPGSAKANGPRLDRDACGGPSAPAPADPVPSTLPPSCPSLGAVSDGAGASLGRAGGVAPAACEADIHEASGLARSVAQPGDRQPDLSLGRVWQRPACVARLLRRDRIRHALIVFAVALVLAGAAFTLVMALVRAPNVGR